jgi:arsenite-transporting ATPase
VRVLLHTGKGGVGKTSLALATALGAARHGHRVCVLSTDAAHSVGDALGRPVGSEPVAVAEGVVAQEVSVLAELERSWSEIQAFLEGLLRAGQGGVAAEELLVLPGLEELVALRAVREVEASGRYDVCVVDCAPTGSALRMLRLPDALRPLMGGAFDAKRRAMRLLRPLADRVGAARFIAPDAVFEAFERLVGDVEDVRQILLDGDRTSARLVVNPARVVVDETRRTYAYLCLFGVGVDALLVNRVLPREAAGGWLAGWARHEQAQLEVLATSFPLPRFLAPLLPREPIGLEALRGLADALFGDADPARRFCASRPIRLAKRAERTVLEIDLPHATRDEVDVLACGDELLVRVRDAQRRIALPASVAGRGVAGVRLARGVLEIAFAP